MTEYFSQTYVAHMAKPKHLAPVGGPLWAASGVGQMEGPRMRTMITVWVALGDGPGRPVERIAWRGVGVPESAPAASAISAFVSERGINATAAAALDLSQVEQLLGGIPLGREDAALRVLQALRRALANADVLGGNIEIEGLGGDERVCHCMGLTVADLRAAVVADGDRLNLQRRTGFGTGCGTCLYVIGDLLDSLEA